MNLILLLLIIIVVILIIMFLISKEGFQYPQQYYFDNNATTFIYDDDIKNTIDKWINCGNPSNLLHKLGQDANKQLELSREIVADDLDVNPDEIYFTGCATESNNIILNDIINNFLINHEGPATIITDNIEHPSILHILDNFKYNNRLNIIKLKVITDKTNIYYGTVDPQDLEYTIVNNDNVILMSLMYANNETGAIQDIETFGKLAKKYNVFFHCDATQAIGKYIIHPKELNINAMTFSGHKFHAPKGVGCLYIQSKCPMLDKNSVDICNQFKINSQEKGVRGGTENIAYISALALALKKVHENRQQKNAKLKAFKNYIIRQLEYNNCEVIKPYYSLDNTILVILKGISCCNKQFAKELSDDYHICLGVSSACQKTKSHILEAMDVKDCFQDKVIRISMSDYNTSQEVKYLVKSIIELLNKHRKTSDFNNNIDNQMN